MPGERTQEDRYHIRPTSRFRNWLQVEPATKDVQIALWERGLESKVYELHIPETPQVDTAELTEGDLDSIAAGTITIKTCCCPCCSCT